jgi:hypothetical protein
VRKPTSSEKPKPKTQPAAASTQSVPDDAWEQVTGSFEDTKDLIIRRALETCTFKGFESGQVHIQMVASKDIYQALVNSASLEKLEKQTRKVFGADSRLTFHFEERVEDDPEPEEETSAPEPDSEVSPSGPGEFSQAEFENDPLIKSALKAFEAKIVDIKQKA